MDTWRVDVEQQLHALSAVQAQEGPGADDPFHASQLHIILDYTNDLLGEFASRLRDGAYDREAAEWVFLLVYPGSQMLTTGFCWQIPDEDTFLRTPVPVPPNDRYPRISNSNTNHPRILPSSP